MFVDAEKLNKGSRKLGPITCGPLPILRTVLADALQIARGFRVQYFDNSFGEYVVSPDNI